MSTTALILVIAGLSMIASRGPLMVAPGRIRDTYLRLFDTDGHMRALGLVFAAVSAFVVWSIWGVTGTTAQVITYFGGFIFLLAVFAMVLMPARMRKLATNIWTGFGERTLRVLGLGGVVIGGWLIWYGMGL